MEANPIANLALQMQQDHHPQLCSETHQLSNQLEKVLLVQNVEAVCLKQRGSQKRERTTIEDALHAANVVGHKMTSFKSLLALIPRSTVLSVTLNHNTLHCLVKLIPLGLWPQMAMAAQNVVAKFLMLKK